MSTRTRVDRASKRPSNHNDSSSIGKCDEKEKTKEGLSIDEMNELSNTTTQKKPKVVLDPIGEVPSIPQSPCTGYCTWTFDSTSRVLLAKFLIRNEEVIVTPEDENYLFQMMERNDISVVSENLAYGLNMKYWNLGQMKSLIGDSYHHKIRMFEKSNANDSFQEIDGFLKMRISDFIDFIQKKSSLSSNGSNSIFEFAQFGYPDKTTIDLNNTSLYMIDLDMTKLLHPWHDDLVKTFKLSSILPGGSHCMLNSVNPSGRPFMGPNLYIAPPSAFTHFHQDGFGTVDSGHLCLSGYNEVVMLRRLDAEHKENALKILKTPNTYDGLYGQPHSDGQKPKWPTHDQIDKCMQMNYYPSVFILKPGQMLHINKGRLHAFRKMSISSLPEEDCHSYLRSQLIKEENLFKEEICVSVAWDWMFRGVSVNGIHNELENTLTCAKLAREHGRQSLAIIENAIFSLAKQLLADKLGNDINIPIKHANATHNKREQTIHILKGIEPSLSKIVNRNEESYNNIMSSCKSIKISAIPNAWQNPDVFPLDAYGSSDYCCKLCYKELANMYLHCEGCDNLLNKDFNICSECYLGKKHIANIQMHPQKKKKHATLNHTGSMIFERSSRCPCKNGPTCTTCHFCLGCSCKCHQEFSLNFRFMRMNEEKVLLNSIKGIIDDGFMWF